MRNADTPDSTTLTAPVTPRRNPTSSAFGPAIDTSSPTGTRPDDPSDFSARATSASQLEDPRRMMINLAVVLVEALAGARNIEQIARWLSNDAWDDTLHRTILSTRALRAKKAPMKRPAVSSRTVRTSILSDNVVEGCVVLNIDDRVKSVIVRMVGLDRRWQAEMLKLV